MFFPFAGSNSRVARFVLVQYTYQSKKYAKRLQKYQIALIFSKKSVKHVKWQYEVETFDIPMPSKIYEIWDLGCANLPSGNMSNCA
jgi:hypothetical protein